MAHSQGSVLFRQLRGLLDGCPDPQPDEVLLERFLAGHDEAAFAALVRRYEAMVLDVCRGVLRHRQDAEDVLQATFLVLARKARSIRKHQSLGSWLHGVAYRLALRARTKEGRRRDREPLEHDPPPSASADDLTVRELRGIVHEELRRLAERYRAALLLCYWDGLTRDEAAARLGMSPGAFKKCLERGRKLLGSRLVRRGLVTSAALLPALLSGAGLHAGLPPVVLTTIARTAAEFAAGKAAGTTATALARGMIQTMNLTKLAMVTVTTVLLCGIGAGVRLAAPHLWSEGGRANAAQQVAPAAEGRAPAGERTDQQRLAGTWRFAAGKADGRPFPAEFLALARLTFTDNGTVTMTMVQEAKSGKYVLVGPGKIDLDVGAGGPDLSPGIYRFDGDNRLTLCVNEVGKARPTQFTSDMGSRQSVFEMARTGPGDEKPTPAEIVKYKGGVDKIREAAAQQASANRLRQIGIAMHVYHDQGKALPAHALYSKDGKTPLLSWRVAILPYLAEEKLYAEFKLDEPWDSAHNIKLLPRIPQLYVLPFGDKAKPGETFYQVVTGPGTLFDGPRRMSFLDIKDGISKTLLAVEATNPVPWTKPADLELPKDKSTRLAVGGSFTSGFNVLFCDGSSRFLANDIPAPSLRAMVTPAAGD